MATSSTSTAVNSDLVNVFTCEPSAKITWEIANIDSDNMHSTNLSSANCYYTVQLHPSISKRTCDNCGNYCGGSDLMVDNRSLVILKGLLKGEHKEKLPVHYRFSILNAKGEKCNTQEGREFAALNSGYNATYNYKTFAFFTIGRDYLNAKGFLMDGKITFYCEIFELNEPNDTEIFNGECLVSHSKNQQALLDSGKDSDVVLEADGAELKAHKLILSTHSPVFSAMFDHEETVEAREGKVKIPDVSANVLQEILRFIYTGQAQKMEENASELFIASDKYQLASLKSYCEKYLSSSLTIEIVPRILQMARLYEATQLEDNCIKYIIEFADEITEEFYEALNEMDPKLSFKLFKLQAARGRK